MTLLLHVAAIIVWLLAILGAGPLDLLEMALLGLMLHGAAHIAPS